MLGLLPYFGIYILRYVYVGLHNFDFYAEYILSS